MWCIWYGTSAIEYPSSVHLKKNGLRISLFLCIFPLLLFVPAQPAPTLFLSLQLCYDLVEYLRDKKMFCISESFYTNISHILFWPQNNLCEFTTWEHNFKKWFCTKKKGVLESHFEGFCYKKINLTWFCIRNSIYKH